VEDGVEVSLLAESDSDDGIDSDDEDDEYEHYEKLVTTRRARPSSAWTWKR